MSIHKRNEDFDPAKRRITVCAKRFYAAWQFISYEETRYYLTGVYIEPHKDGGVTMTATDGHTMAVIRDEKAYFEGDAGWICQVPKQPFNSMMKRANAGSLHFVGNSVYLTDSIMGVIAREPEFDPTQITHQHLAIAFAEPIDGVFPDWRRVVPQNFAQQSERISIDAMLIDRFTRAIKVMQDSKKTVGIDIATPPDDQTAIIIRAEIEPDFFGVIMPRRSTRADGRIPSWLDLPDPEQKPAPANDAKPADTPKQRPVLGLKTAPTIKSTAA
ncbi:hypothetical protein [Paremcibacter congregatus]|uniref:hypothetical protein n=1 Tax=Paremcibacter congregatus TaxID=2043170 RepID=UPI003A8D2AB6